jgi:glucose-6-phosphate 1-dehydrogenase
MKAGKALNEQKTEIRIQYKDVTQGIFKDISRNELVIRVQPGEAVYLKMNTKAPGLAMRSVPTEMDLTYKRRFSDLKIPGTFSAFVVIVHLERPLTQSSTRPLCRGVRSSHPRRLQR